MQRNGLIPGALVIVAALLLVACDSDTAGGQPYYTRGIIQGFSPNRKTAEVQHENIPGFMPSMTMGLSVRNPKEMIDRKVGDAISFRMLVTNTDVFIDHIKPIALSQVKLEEPATGKPRLSSGASRLKEGSIMPAFAGIDQDGKPITLETFRGHPFVLTFVFTRCPIPNFCPLMSTNFSELQRAIKSGDGSLSQVRLLSVTLDSEFDTPQILKEYGASRGADPAIWTFATGKELDPLVEAFSVFRKTEGGTLSHGLATALVSADGTIRKIWRGNGWKPAEVIDAIKTTN
jgi:protein SCO1/2